MKNRFERMFSALLLTATAATSVGVSIGASSAMAASSVEADFHANALALPNRLLNRGYFQVGDLRVNDLVNSVSSIEVRVTSRIQHKAVPGDNSLRDSAQWQSASGRSISINRELWQRTSSKEKPVLALHETLGALGYTDQVYSCSGTIWLLTNESARAKLSAEEIRAVEKMAEDNCRSAGGSTGVTGGGDSFGVGFKLLRMENTIKRMSQSQDRQQRLEALDDMQGALNGSDVFIDRYGISAARAKAKAAQEKGTPPYILPHVPSDISSIRVTVNNEQVPQDARNGWTFDPSINGIRLHGRFNTGSYNEMSVMYAH